VLREPFRELVVLSHLRWDGVWQRPQHLISRLGRDLPTRFVEEPVADGGAATGIERRSHGSVDRVRYRVPGPERWVSFGDPAATGYGDALVDVLGRGDGRVVWLYTAMALDLAERLDPALLVYDVMDDLTAFRGASPEHALRHRAALRRADIVFTGGRSLHQGVTPVRSDGVHCYPSGVEPEHFAAARRLRPDRRPRPVAGYVGVVDERLDLDLLAGLAEALPEWDIDVVGPVVKIDEDALPRAANLRYPGRRPYGELPSVLADFDVALMPFALNEATRSISPTKTLEYFAAGLPVVSTRVPDVVADYGDVVTLADDAAGFAAGCRAAAAGSPAALLDRLAPVLDRQHWDTIAASMAVRCAEAYAAAGQAVPATATARTA
jgi:glycosyltransferase involved in cell wall biosynthesis